MRNIYKIREASQMNKAQRLQPRHPIQAGSGILGGEKPMVCIPLVGKTREEILSEAANVPAIAPDIIELRIDAWDFVEDISASVAMIEEVRKTVGELPVILTCRGHWEGGFKKVSDGAKFGIYSAAVKAGLVNFIDVELIYGDEKLKEILSMLEGTKTSLIISFHDFKKTPTREEIISILKQQIAAGAQVAKLAAMPLKEEDVLNVLSATLEVRRQFPCIPIITMSMGQLGAVTRLVGGLFGSDLTFAVGSKSSAPGQIPVAELRKCFEVVHPNHTEA